MRVTLSAPGGGGVLTASRVMKARRSSCCCLCGALVLVGQRIGQISAGEGREGWAHTACITGRQPKDDPPRTEPKDDLYG